MAIGLPNTTADGAPMQDKDNIINVREGQSLYQICIKLRRRLSGVPGFRPYLEELEEREAEGIDPVSSLWQCFRSGPPLLTIFNASHPEKGDLQVNTSRPDKIGKEAAFLFIRACMEQMDIPPTEIFTVTDLYSDNTTGFVKVTKSVNRVLDLLEMSGNLQTESDSSQDGSVTAPSPAGPRQMTRRQHIVKELVETEKQYVHHLQNLQMLKKEIEESGSLTGDSVHTVFLNLNNLLDFAQRFLIRVEQQNEIPESQQNWGQLFIHYKEPFRQYEPFIANQKRCEITCQKEWDKMVANARSTLSIQMLANPTILNGFLLKPFQRLTKYPLLLKDLQKETEDRELKSDLASAIEIIQDVLHQADESIDKETREEALQDLRERVEDWKQLSLGSFGELLLYGSFNVMKDITQKNEEKEYHIYLFRRILIMCKDVNMNKQKNKLMGVNKTSLSLRGKAKMNLKGRIYFTNVTNITSTSTPGNYALQISWKADITVETFVIKFKMDETLKRWHTMIETQRAACLLEARNKGTVDTELTSLRGVRLENPYANQDDDEDNSRMSGTTYVPSEFNGRSEFSMSRNASSTSLSSRTRSGTNGSGTSNPHLSAGRMRIPTSEMNTLPTINTRVGGVTSPGEYGGGSYMSPIDRDTTPPSASSRSSAQASFAYRGPPPQPNGYQPNGYRSEETYRNTAPAMGRNQRDANPYLVNGRGSKPALPPGSVQSANNGSRMRSASSPDIHPNLQHNRRYVDNVPTVPPIPAHVTKQMGAPNRSQNNSPQNGLPVRTSTPQGQLNGIRPNLNSHFSSDTTYSQRTYGHGPSLSTERTFSPPLSTPSSEGDSYMPTQLRAKVRFDDNYVSMIIPSNIHFRSLTDRIDAKLARFTNHSIASGSVRLRYQDEDGDFIWIDSDEAVKDALLEWREAYGERANGGQHSEILLFAHAISGEPMMGT